MFVLNLKYIESLALVFVDGFATHRNVLFKYLYSKSDMTEILILTYAFHSSIPYSGIPSYSKKETD